MKTTTTQALLALNQRFYSVFGPAFAATRRRVQPGIRRVLAGLLPGLRWLDLGCGSGSVACAWAETVAAGSYLGVDFSTELLAEARQVTASINQSACPIDFLQLDLGRPDWPVSLPAPAAFDGIFCFAALHHIPAADNRLRLLQQVRALLPTGGLFYHSEWQFQNSPRLMARVQPWSAAGLDEADLDPGDTLLDWRQALPGQVEQTGLRYVHLFNRPELADLAARSGFELLDEFESDGEGGRLALYQTWQAV